MSTNRYIPAAESIAKAIPVILAEQGLKPLISRFVLTETEQGEAWLFVIMSDRVLDSIECYTKPSVLFYISAALHGHHVVYSRSGDMRYGILLSPSTNQPKTRPCL
jgi:hypothetical protein